MALPPSQQKRDQLQKSERDQQILDLRMRGMAYRDIARVMRGRGYRVNKSNVGNIINARLDELREKGSETAANIREMEVRRLDAQLASLWNKALGDPANDVGPDLAAHDRLLRLADRRAKLLGLDAPTKTAATDPTGEKPAMGVTTFDLGALSTEELETLARLQQKAAASPIQTRQGEGVGDGEDDSEN